MKIVFLDEATVTRGDLDFSGLRGLGKYVGHANIRAVEAVIEAGEGAKVMIANKSPFAAMVFEALPQLKLVCVAATGYNNVDITAAKTKGVRVCNVAGYSTESVADQTMAMILNLATRLWQYDADVKRNAWCESPTFTMLSYPTFELSGKILGIVGFGAIGQAVAKRAWAFGLRVMMCNHRKQDVGDTAYVPFDELISRADIISLHCPLTDETHHLIDAAAIGRMKPEAILINMARGPIVDEAAAAAALNNGRLAGIGTDVLSTEPPDEKNPLLNAKNTLITPHVAWAAVESRQRLVDEIVENIKAFLAGQRRNIVV